MKSKTPKVFGKRPILMQRYNGSIRIIYPNGKVSWIPHMEDLLDRTNMEILETFVNEDGNNARSCIEGSTQEEAYIRCINLDNLYAAVTGEQGVYSAFLGYL